jgi:hypothetical protein
MEILDGRHGGGHDGWIKSHLLLKSNISADVNNGDKTRPKFHPTPDFIAQLCIDINSYPRLEARLHHRHVSLEESKDEPMEDRI